MSWLMLSFAESLTLLSYSSIRQTWWDSRPWSRFGCSRLECGKRVYRVSYDRLGEVDRGTAMSDDIWLRYNNLTDEEEVAKKRIHSKSAFQALLIYMRETASYRSTYGIRQTGVVQQRSSVGRCMLVFVTKLRRPTIGVDVQLGNRLGSDRSVS
jgi:hypothetical protein